MFSEITIEMPDYQCTPTSPILISVRNSYFVFEFQFIKCLLEISMEKIVVVSREDFPSRRNDKKKTKTKANYLIEIDFAFGIGSYDRKR